MSDCDFRVGIKIGPVSFADASFPNVRILVHTTDAERNILKKQRKRAKEKRRRVRKLIRESNLDITPIFSSELGLKNV